MYEFAGMDVFQRFEYLIDDVLLMNFLENAGTDNHMEIYVATTPTCLHEVENQV
mgnify:FL=1